MPHYLDNDNNLHYLSDSDLVNAKSLGLALPDKSWIEATDDQVASMQDKNASQLWAEYQSKAQALLDKTDIVCLRCYKAGVVYPLEWQTYTSDLRAIVSAKSGDPTAVLPQTPDYPAGT